MPLSDGYPVLRIKTGSYLWFKIRFYEENISKNAIYSKKALCLQSDCKFFNKLKTKRLSS
jgi:hypothetical protein